MTMIDWISILMKDRVPVRRLVGREFDYYWFRWMKDWAAESEWNWMTSGITGSKGLMDHRCGLGWDWGD